MSSRVKFDSEAVFYGYAVDGKPTFFPHETPLITDRAGYPAVVVKQGPAWFYLRGDGRVHRLTEHTADYRRFVKNGDWVPFPGNPFKNESAG